MSDTLDSQLAAERNFPLAENGKRLANYFVDMIAYYAMAGGLGVLIGLFAMANDAGDELLYELEKESVILDYVLGIIMITTYYTCMEYFFKGKTLGKFLTKTRAVGLDNSRLTFGQALGRSFSRLVPFEAFSFLGTPGEGWHDKWPKTKVIEDRDWVDVSF